MGDQVIRVQARKVLEYATKNNGQETTVLESLLRKKVFNTKIAFFLARLHEKLIPEVKAIESTLNSINEEHIAKDSNGNPIVMFETPDGQKQYRVRDKNEYNAKVNAMLDETIEIPLYPLKIKLSALPNEMLPIDLLPLIAFADVEDDIVEEEKSA